MNELAKRENLSFEGQELTQVTYRGQRVILATEFSKLLGYGRSNEISERVMSKWKDEFFSGEDYFVLKGEELRQFKDAVGSTSSYAKVVVLLTIQGAQLVAIKSQTEIGRRVRPPHCRLWQSTPGHTASVTMWRMSMRLRR